MNQPGFLKAHHIAERHRQVLGKQPEFLAKKSEDKKGALYIYEAIGESWWSDGGVTAKKVKDALAELKGVKTLDIFINSEGGDVFEGKAIFAQLERFDAELVVHVDGLAASAATFIAMAGDKIITAPAATWMIHEVRSAAFGRAEDMRAMADLLDMENQTFAETYAKRTKQTVEDVLAWMNAETWMNAQTAKDRGFTDEIAAEDAESEEVPATEKAAASIARIVSLEAQTRSRIQRDVTLARQGQRLQELSGRASPAPARGRP